MNFSPDNNYQQPEPEKQQNRKRRSQEDILQDKIAKRDNLNGEIKALQDKIKKAEVEAEEKEFKAAMEKVKGMGITAAQIIEAAADLKAKSRTGE